MKRATHKIIVPRQIGRTTWMLKAALGLSTAAITDVSIVVHSQHMAELIMTRLKELAGEQGKQVRSISSVESMIDFTTFATIPVDAPVVKECKTLDHTIFIDHIVHELYPDKIAHLAYMTDLPQSDYNTIEYDKWAHEQRKAKEQ